MLRRNWMPILALVVAVGFVGWLGWINVRGSGRAAVVVPTATPTVAVSGTASAAPTPTVDPAEAEVKAAAVKWVQAYVDTYKNGDTHEVDALTVPGSQAEGNAGVPLAEINRVHKTLIPDHLDCPKDVVSVAGNAATAEISCTVSGMAVTWPGKQPLQATTASLQFRMSFQLVGKQWLVDTLH